MVCEGVVGFEFVSPGSTCEEVVAQILQHFLGRPWGRLFLRRSDGLRYSVAGGAFARALSLIWCSLLGRFE